MIRVGGNVFIQRQHRDAVAVIGDGGRGDRILDRKAVAVRDQTADQFLRARLEHHPRLAPDRAEQAEEIIARIGQIEQDEGFVGEFAQADRLALRQRMVGGDDRVGRQIDQRLGMDVVRHREAVGEREFGPAAQQAAKSAPPGRPPAARP